MGFVRTPPLVGKMQKRTGRTSPQFGNKGTQTCSRTFPNIRLEATPKPHRSPRRQKTSAKPRRFPEARSFSGTCVLPHRFLEGVLVRVGGIHFFQHRHRHFLFGVYCIVDRSTTPRLYSSCRPSLTPITNLLLQARRGQTSSPSVL